MDKKTLSHYGWIVVLVLILAVLLAFVSPLGSFIADGFHAFTGGFISTNNNALDVVDPDNNDYEIPANKCSHENVQLHNQKDATCTSNGYTGDRICDDCGTKMETGSVIDKLDHTVAKDAAVPATCTNNGKTEGSHCSVCKTVLVAQVDVNKLGHDFGAPFIALEATCDKDGISRTQCRRDGCGATEDDAIPAKGHNYTVKKGYAATCTTTGLTDGEVCTSCGGVKKAQTSIPATGHTKTTIPAVPATCLTTGKTEGVSCSKCGTVLTAPTTVSALGHKLGTAITMANATCEGEGQTKATCTRSGCSYYETAKIAALGHNKVADNAVAATCTTTGLTAGEHCTRCSYKVAQTTTPALGHNKVTDKAVAATCTTTGLTAGEHCTRCSYKVAQNTVAALGHNTVTDAAVSATCTTTGLTEGQHCTRCSYKVAQTVVPAKGHNTVIDNAVAATCTSTGLTAGEHCTRCSYKVAQTTTPALGHNTVTDKAVAATCLNTGLTEGKHCTRCSYKIAQNVVAALGHNKVTDEAVAPTCTETGLTEGEHCTRCSYKIAQDTVKALGHSTVTDIAVPATCTTTGLTEGVHCTRCTYKVPQYQTTALGHSMIKDNAVPATCTGTGLSEGEHCARCTYKIAQKTVAALGHEYTSFTSKEATCTVNGTTTHTCIRNDHTYTTEITAPGHSLINDAEVPATCTKDGTTAGQHCGNCTYSVGKTIIPALKHEYTKVVNKEATCTVPGQVTYTCNRGDHTYTETIYGKHVDENICDTTYMMGDGIFHFATKQYLEIDQGYTEMTEELYQWFLENTTRVDQAGPAVLKDANGYYMEGSVKFNESLTALPEAFHTDQYSWFIWVDFSFTYDNITGFGRIAISTDECACGKAHTYIDAWKGKTLHFFYVLDQEDADYYCDNCGAPVIYGTWKREGYAMADASATHNVNYQALINGSLKTFDKMSINFTEGTDASGLYKSTEVWYGANNTYVACNHIDRKTGTDEMLWGDTDTKVYFGDEIQVVSQEFHDWWFKDWTLEEWGTGLQLNTVYFGVLEDDGRDYGHSYIKDYALVFQEDGTVWVFEDTICPTTICINDDQTYTVDGEYITIGEGTTLKIVDSETLYHDDAWGVYFGNLYAEETDTSGVKFETIYNEVWGNGETFVFHSNNTVTFTNSYGNSFVLDVEWSENSKYICDIEGLGWASLALYEDKVYCPSVTSWPTAPEAGDGFLYNTLYTGSTGMSYTRSEVGLMFVDVYNNEAKAYELWAMTFTKDVNGKWMADGYFEPLYAHGDGSWVDDYGATYTVTGPETIELGSMPNAFIQTGGGTLTLNKTVLSYGVQYEKVYDEIDSNYTFVFHDNNTVTVNNGSTSKTLTVRWEAPLFCYIEGYGYLYVEYDGYGVDYASYNKELF